MWYLIAFVLVIVILKDPTTAGHLARQCLELLSKFIGAMSKMASAS